MLQRLDGLSCVPRLMDYRIGHEHYFLVREYVDGDSLAVEINRRHPFGGEGSSSGVAEYTQWAVETLDRIDRGITQMHERGVYFGDLHPGNVMFRADGSVCFIDFETASTDPQTRQFQGAPGFVVPPDCPGPAADRYMLASLRIALFVPLSGMLPWGPDKADQVLDFISAHFPVPQDFARKVHADLGPAHRRHVEQQVQAQSAVSPRFGPSSPTAVQDVADGILATATPHRDDRLFPGDAAQFFTPEGGVAFAHGAAGVLWALHEVGAAVPESHVDWLEQAAGRLGGAPLGFYNGLCGIAFTLDQLGRGQVAHDLLQQARGHDLDHLGIDLFSGLAGLGLTELHFAGRTGDREGIDRAAAVAERVLERSARPPTSRRVAAGLLRGQAGAALLLLRLYEQTRDCGYLDAAQQLLHRDLAALGWTAEGAWAPGAIGHRLGVGIGSGGTAMVLHDFLAHRFDPQLAAVRDTVRLQARCDLARTVSMLQGQVGTVLTMLYLDEAPDAALLRTYLDYLGLLAAHHGDNIAFLGYEGLRISTDLMTGAAGVLLVLDGLTTDRCPRLPFLTSLPGGRP